MDKLDTEQKLQIKKTFWMRGAVLGAAAIYISVSISSFFIMDNAVEGCIRNGTFKNAEAANWGQASKVRKEKDKDNETSNIYAKNSQVIRNTIPMPDDWKPRYARVVKLDDNTTITVTDRGVNKDDRFDGCKAAYKPLFPF